MLPINKSLENNIAFPSALFRKINLGDCDHDKEDVLKNMTENL
ncbi:hypothetical protein BMS3Abin17_01275 [archaeon BMS3Abin17]|nr:hypothetical protein BMS3Abin17_01275 [archaeon BMS3Abin17]